MAFPSPPLSSISSHDLKYLRGSLSAARERPQKSLILAKSGERKKTFFFFKVPFFPLRCKYTVGNISLPLRRRKCCSYVGGEKHLCLCRRRLA